MNLLLALALAAAPAVPATPKKPVTDTYFGTKIVDDYRWLEDGADAKVSAWSDAQNAYSRSVLDASKNRPALEKRITELLSHQSPTWYGVVHRQGKVFAYKRAPPKAQPMIVTMAPDLAEASEKLLFDPEVFDPTGNTSIDFMEPSLDGKYIAICLSRAGTERGDVHVFETATGKELPSETVPNANSGTAGGTLAWFSNGFFYTRHPKETERPKEDLGFYQELWRHTLGTKTDADVHELGKGGLRIAEHFVSTSADGTWASDRIQKGDGGEYELYLRPPSGVWTKVTEFSDAVTRSEFGLDGALYVMSKKGAPKGRVLRLALVPGKLTLADATEFMPEGEGGIEALIITATRVTIVEQMGGPTRLRFKSYDGKQTGTIDPPRGESYFGSVLPGDDLLIGVTGYLTPTAWRRYTAKTGDVTPTRLTPTLNVDLSPYEVVSDQCTSKDGTKIPLTIVRKKGAKQDGTAPVYFSAYGGFGVSISPHYSRVLPAWLEQGGVFAEANIRGGREFGETWHQQGSLTNKQNGYDDFLACAKLLVDKKYSAPKKLVIEGGSNGGLLMGAALTQAPSQFAAVVAYVGYFDMLRFETAPNGVFNTTEYGSVSDEAQFKALSAYSPFHHVKKGTQYPPTIFLTGKNDPRVDPFHSRKMVAKLQASGSKQKFLLRTSDTGHGGGTPLAERISQEVDAWVFVMDALGMSGTVKVNTEAR
ncbi:MAG: prolyl oligopeptidase family serine peptidase [Archangium sp.]